MKKQNRKQIVKKLDQIFSEYIRLRDKYKCFTCGKQGYEKDGVMTVGHLFSRVAYSTRWNILNSNCQCKSCNMRHEYDFEIYRNIFVQKYGQQKYDDLYRYFKTPVKYTNNDLLVLIKYFKQEKGKLGNE